MDTVWKIITCFGWLGQGKAQGFHLIAHPQNEIKIWRRLLPFLREDYMSLTDLTVKTSLQERLLTWQFIVVQYKIS